MYQGFDDLDPYEPSVYHMKAHEEMRKILEEVAPDIKPSDIYFRPVENYWEVEELRLLDRDWFKDLTFGDYFFDNLLNDVETLTCMTRNMKMRREH